MAMHPLLTLLSTRPQLLLDHAAAYAQLGQDEMRLASAQLQRQTLLALASGLLLLLSLTLAGVAAAALALLWLAMPETLEKPSFARHTTVA